jgi:hypothetical protein
MDDIMLDAFSTRLLIRIMASLCSEFATTFMGSLHYFLGVTITCDSTDMNLS